MGLANVCWCNQNQNFIFQIPKRWLWTGDGSRVSKPVLVQVGLLQRQQICRGAYKIQSHLLGHGKMRFWIPGRTLSDTYLQFCYPTIATSDTATAAFQHRHMTDSHMLHMHRGHRTTKPRSLMSPRGWRIWHLTRYFGLCWTISF